MSDVILFAFWGRQGCVEVQLPFIRRILDEHPNVEFHGWNLARNPEDSAYLQTITEDGIEVNNTFYGPRSWQRIPHVWTHYARAKFQKKIFVKIDDDVAFLETDRFGDFVEAIGADGSGRVFSGDVINNGACTPLHPELWEGFEELEIPLLDVHMSNGYAQMAHSWFFDNWQTVVGRPVQKIPTEDWLSINCVGFDWPTLSRITAKIGRNSPREIAGRKWHPRNRIGDEGAANLLPRVVVRGFTAAHVSFGPQHLTGEQWTLWLKNYGDIARRYLG